MAENMLVRIELTTKYYLVCLLSVLIVTSALSSLCVFMYILTKSFPYEEIKILLAK